MFGAFRMPQEDLNGRCNILYGARFAEGSKTDCSAQVEIQNECTSTLNPLEWINV